MKQKYTFSIFGIILVILLSACSDPTTQSNVESDRQPVFVQVASALETETASEETAVYLPAIMVNSGSHTSAIPDTGQTSCYNTN
ncbi:MAG: hypothetical protein GY805_09190, partial [Chloroflexi bacterium]|nr:hypothetical protein [Chloroflexota bacterium]